MTRTRVPLLRSWRPAEGEDLVGLRAERLVCLARTEEAVGRERELDEAGDAVAGAVATLDLLE